MTPSEEKARERTIQRFRDNKILLPTFDQLENPEKIPAKLKEQLQSIHPDEPHPLNLFRINWYNSPDRRGMASVPGHLLLPESLTGVKAPIYVALGERFPMVNVHKVLAAYSCLVPRLIEGRFDPTTHKAVWPSTGNYCRGGVAVSKIMGCRGVAILPEEMSQERFDWLDNWVMAKEDVIKTPGGESNVKEIYDKCAEVSSNPENVVLNQFAEYANALGHYKVTGRALGHIFEHAREQNSDLSLFAFTSATGSAGTISAGDRLKEDFGARICAVESTECPTLLGNGFGEHNIQGIGDKHVPLIHNVMNTDYVAGISDAATDSLAYLFNHPEGKRFLVERRGVPVELVEHLSSFGYSGIANVLAAIKIAKYHNLDESQALITVATDSWQIYKSDEEMILEKRFQGQFDMTTAAEVYGRYMMGVGTHDFMEASQRDRERMFNLGYFTWVEQQGIPVEHFRARKSHTFWNGLRPLLQRWDAEIERFNAEVEGSLDLSQFDEEKQQLQSLQPANAAAKHQIQSRL
jgi:cysteine synthase